ncbi:hypothetical protein [Aeribacillus alveayuensis]|uniref:Uncharacterized protein n=1 Tax=Aeribacillus alveayuensis TaxID=279215 RepID=A0ABT9VM11_9BACI|nr:hypothetical protein [Bacillus alveayuensis]
MTEIATFPPIGTKNNVSFSGPSRTFFRKAGMASFMFVSSLSNIANATLTIDPIDVVKQVNVTTGVLTKKLNNPPKNEKEVN